MLQHLIKLDLSKNQLENLPEDIGKLQQLQHLDLYQNKLKKIPISFSQLKNLRWLDLKENNFDSSYLNIVGDCLDDKQCRTCAVNVVKAMKSAASEQERKRQQELKIRREEEAAKKKEEEMIALEKKRTKKLEKERRKIQWEEEQKLKELAAPLEEVDNTRNVSVESEVFETIEETKSSKSCFGSCIMALFIAVTAVTVGVYFYCENHSSDQNCIVLNQTTEKIYDVLKTWLKSTLEMFNLFVDSLKDKV
uniref:Leucine-rich repeat-containing protein 59-like n=1 Tax=Ciona intestinalis TaxID=7719 RepID=F6SVW0_CIOIN|nr:leucine-rich repeat-containing protein 59-like [Ciona intestinalis]XP_026693537.1 leucine-rich repeat-containing protein 59-like [Ciona intestinalis]|eukprot:XP_026693536.1 leucine-rich repeat-containing protein 59-like [Ciona intestinalis]